MPMDPKLKSDWLIALRSGEYKQAHGSLQVGNSFCCLGVLCKVAGLKIEPETGNAVTDDQGRSIGYEPIAAIISDFMMTDLYYRNDGCQTYHRHTFAEIADLIEERL
jgi:hypothetical protein